LDVKLLALDLDGTLLNSRHQVSERNIDAINKAQEKGVNIVIATGRTNLGAEDIFHSLGLKEYLIAYNGALIKNMAEDKIIKHIPLPLDQSLEILKFVEAEDLYVNLYMNSSVYANKKGEEYEYYSRIMNIEPVVLEEDLHQFLNRPTTKMLIIEKDLKKVDYILKSLEEDFSDRLNITKSISDCIDVMSKGVSKGSALSDLSRKLNILPEEAAVVGDSNNDIEMMQFAGISGAVANAEIAVKESADYITSSNDQDGVAEFIEKFVF